MSEENESLIGFDPLAWMKEEDEPPAEPAAPPAETAPAAVEPMAAEAPRAAPAPVVEQAVAEPVAVAEAVVEAPVQPAAAEGELDLGEALDIAHVSQLYDRLHGALQQGRELPLDASRLERVDAAGLQLLSAYGRELRNIGAAIAWRGEPSAALRDAAALLDLEEVLGLVA